MEPNLPILFPQSENLYLIKMRMKDPINLKITEIFVFGQYLYPRNSSLKDWHAEFRLVFILYRPASRGGFQTCIKLHPL